MDNNDLLSPLTNTKAPPLGRRCAMFEYLTYLKTLDLIVLGFIAFLVCWNIVEYNLRR